MKNNFKFYTITWAILFVVYNLVIFLFKPIPGYVINYDARFWISWVVVIATFVGQLVCARVAFKSETKEKLFLNISIITQSYAALVLSVIVASILMLIPDCPYWIAAIVCSIVFGYSAIMISGTKAAANIVEKRGAEVADKTAFIKNITSDAESLVSKGTSPEMKIKLKKVYELLRYSDPMSKEELKSIESKMAVKFNDISDAVKENNSTLVNEYCEEFFALVEERKTKCKALK